MPARMKMDAGALRSRVTAIQRLSDADMAKRTRGEDVTQQRISFKAFVDPMISGAADQEDPDLIRSESRFRVYARGSQLDALSNAEYLDTPDGRMEVLYASRWNYNGIWAVATCRIQK